jgi:hypothetical protein
MLWEVHLTRLSLDIPVGATVVLVEASSRAAALTEVERLYAYDPFDTQVESYPAGRGPWVVSTSGVALARRVK